MTGDDDGPPADDVLPACVIFTSGTSGGDPKGVILSAEQFLNDFKRPYSPMPFVAVSAYSPAWGTDKRLPYAALTQGGRIGFQCKARSIFDTWRAVSPFPSMSLVPFLASQLMTMFADVRQREMERLMTLERRLLQPPGPGGEETRGPGRGGQKSEEVGMGRPSAAVIARSVATASVFVDWMCLGGRAVVVSCGGAMVRPDVLSFLQDTLFGLAVESYGTTECGAVLQSHRPAPSTQVRLLDRGDLGYTTADLPFPRGEIVILGPDMIDLESWLCDATTKAALRDRYLPDGYMRTGDIGEQRPDGTYRVVDRASAVEKLANGKFFSAERVEHILSSYYDGLPGGLRGEREEGTSPAQPQCQTVARLRISAVFVAVDPSDHATIIVMVRTCGEDKRDAAATGKRTPNEGDAGHDPCLTLSCPVLSLAERQVLLRDMQRVCAENGVPKDETPSIVAHDADAVGWTVENGCLTSSRKVNRQRLRARLDAALEAERQGGVLRRDDHVVPLSRDPDEGSTTTARVPLDVTTLAMRLVPGIASSSSFACPATGCDADVLHQTFVALGCDSLSLSRVPRLLSGILRAYRAELSREDAARLVRAEGILPPSALSVPLLMSSTPFRLATLVMEGATEGGESNAPQPEPGQEADANTDTGRPGSQDPDQTATAKSLCRAIDGHGRRGHVDSSYTTGSRRSTAAA